MMQVLPPPPPPVPIVIYYEYDFADGLVTEENAAHCAISAARDFAKPGALPRRLEREQFQRCIIINVED